MPRIMDPVPFREHLREVQRNGRHWLFCTDDHDAHVSLVGLALLLILDAGASDERDLRYGVIDVDYLPERRRLSVSWLTVAKSAMPTRWVKEFVQGFGIERPDLRRTSNFPISRDPVFLWGLVDMVRRGRAYPAGSVPNN